MKLSCGFLIVHEDKLLLCHVTQSNPSRWDIPKGEKEANESDIQCAIRELKEETGLTVLPNQVYDLGMFDYLPNKQLHLFKCNMDTLVDVKTLDCSSMFTRYSKLFKEVDDYKLIPMRELEAYASKSLYTCLAKTNLFLETYL